MKYRQMEDISVTLAQLVSRGMIALSLIVSALKILTIYLTC